MSNIRLHFEHPYMLILLIPAIILAMIPFFKLPKHRRNSNGRRLSLTLHCIILTLTTLVLSGFRIHIENSIKTTDVLFLVDNSYSETYSEQDIDEYLKKVFKEYDYNYRLGIVAFGNDAKYVSKLSKNKNNVIDTYLKHDYVIDDSGTNFANALYFAKSIFKNPKKGRIIIISDGLETDEDGIKACKNLSGDGVIVDSVYLENKIFQNDLLIKNVSFLEEPSIGKDNKLLIDIASYNIRSGILKVYDEKTEIYSKEVSLINEQEHFEIPISFNTSNVHTIKVNIENQNDLNKKNNTYYTFANIAGSGKILIVEGTSDISSSFSSVLTNVGYEYQTIKSSDIDKYNLSEYSQVVLMNVNYNDLPKNSDSLLEEYVSSGGNLLTTGGRNTYNLGNMKGTTFDEFMPIKFETLSNRPQAYMLVIDNSSSMKETIAGSTKTKMDLAKEAAITAVNSLKNYDYIGIITFDANAKLVCEITPATKKDEIISKINDIKVGYGTNYVPAFRMANTNLIAFNEVNYKSVVFISDGNPQDSSYKTYISLMRDKDIVTSTIALGDSINADELKSMADVGGGKYFQVKNANELVPIMLELTVSFSTDAFITEKVTPTIKTHGEIVRNIKTLPDLEGYNQVIAKTGTTTAIEIDDNPLYTYWNYKSGKVGCFMSDMSNTYSKAYFESNQGITLIKNIMSSMLGGKTSSREMGITFIDGNYSKTIQVRTSSSGGNNAISAKVTYPSGTTKNIKFALISNNTYQGFIEYFNEPGLYKVEIVKKSSSKVTSQTEYFTFSYSKEYIYDQNGITYLNELSKVSEHNKLFEKEDTLFTNKIEYDVNDYNPQAVLLIIVLILFLFDIVIRKFKFKNIFKKVEIKNS